MLLLLPITAFLIFYLTLREKGSDWRRAILAASVLSGMCVVVITEALSVPRLITRWGVATFWMAICIMGFLYLRNLRRMIPRPQHEVGLAGENLDRVTKALLGATGIMVIVIAVTAVVSAPNVWDAMEYHLPSILVGRTASKRS